MYPNLGVQYHSYLLLEARAPANRKKRERDEVCAIPTGKSSISSLKKLKRSLTGAKKTLMICAAL